MKTLVKLEKTVADFDLYLSQRTSPVSVILKYLYPGINRTDLITEMTIRGWSHKNVGEFDTFSKESANG